MTAEIDGLRWDAFGPPEAPPLLVSAGLGGAGAYWTPNLPALIRENRVISYDHRGTGRSSRVLTGPVSVDSMADDVLHLMDGLGIERASFMGHAAGGVIGLALALRAPDRIARLIVVNGWSKLDPHFARCFDTRLTLLRDTGPRAYIRAQPFFLYPAAWISRHSAALDEEAEQQLADFQGSENISKRVAALRLFNIDRQLGQIRTPTLLVAAEDDMLVPSLCSERLAEAMPNAQLGLLPRGGHACNVTERAAFDTLVTSWLNKIAG